MSNSAELGADPPGDLLGIRVTALYQFTTFDDCAAVQRMLKRGCEAEGLCGTLILAPEGINGTIAGAPHAVERVLDAIRSLPGCAALAVKDSHAAGMPFHRMKVRIKKEIVTMGEEGVSPVNGVGRYVPPEAWNALISDPGTILIDTRNDYEVEIGTFRGAVDPRTTSFREFPTWFRANRDALAAMPKVAMFCTGGIRCEKATALLKAEGLDEVYHLEGGILKYLEVVPPEESMWEGECFVFDQRVALTHGLQAGRFDLCHACREPLAEADRASPLFEEGVSCPACHDRRGPEQRARYAERYRQERLASERGERHVGARQHLPPRHNRDG